MSALPLVWPPGLLHVGLRLLRGRGTSPGSSPGDPLRLPLSPLGLKLAEPGSSEAAGREDEWLQGRGSRSCTWCTNQQQQGPWGRKSSEHGDG